jgi:hypothetical protein
VAPGPDLGNPRSHFALLVTFFAGPEPGSQRERA